MMRRLRISYSEIDHWLIFHVIARPRSDFIYTKNSAWPRSHFIDTKIAARPRSDFLYTKNFLSEIYFLLEICRENP